MGIRFLFVILPLFICSPDLYPGPVGNTATVTDAGVERLISQSRYRDASDLIRATLKAVPESDLNHQLYYSNRLSIVQLRLRNIDSALMFARRSLGLSKNSNDSALIADAWKAASYAYNNAGELDSALFFTRKMLQYGERNGDKKLTRNALVSMATILTQNKRYGEALHYYREAYQLTVILKDTANYSGSLFNLGLSLLNLKRTDSCLVCLQNAAELAKKHGQNDNLVYIYGTMADCYLLIKNDSERKRYLLLANSIAEKIGNRQFLAMGYSNLAQGAIESGQFVEAAGYGQKALDLLKQQPYPVLKMKVDSLMSVACKGSGKIAEAYAYLEAFVREKELLVSEKQQQRLNDMVVTLEAREKDLTIATQKLELARKQRNTEVLTLIIGIILLLAGGQFLFILRSRRFRKELYRKEQDLDRQSSEIRAWMEWRQSREAEGATTGTAGGENPGMTAETGEQSAQDSLFAEFRELFETQKLYLDPDLHLKEVIRILGTNQKYLYQAISENSDANFRSFVNRYRVDEAKRMIERKTGQREKLNFQEIGLAAGFNSVVSFYRAFKHFTGLTPKEYADEAKRVRKKGETVSPERSGSA